MGKALYLNKFESHSPKDALCQVWLKLAQWFWTRRFGELKILNDTQIKSHILIHLHFFHNGLKRFEKSQCMCEFVKVRGKKYLSRIINGLVLCYINIFITSKGKFKINKP